MLCYRDRSYCANQEECANENCSRRFTESDKLRAIRIGLPVAWMPMKDTCGNFVALPIARIHTKTASTMQNTTGSASPVACGTQPAG